jgi:hypothetical protein
MNRIFDHRQTLSQREHQVRQREETAMFKPRRKASDEVNPACTLTLDF